MKQQLIFYESNDDAIKNGHIYNHQNGSAFYDDQTGIITYLEGPDEKYKNSHLLGEHIKGYGYPDGKRIRFEESADTMLMNQHLYPHNTSYAEFSGAPDMSSEGASIVALWLISKIPIILSVVFWFLTITGGIPMTLPFWVFVVPTIAACVFIVKSKRHLFGRMLCYGVCIVLALVVQAVTGGPIDSFEGFAYVIAGTVFITALPLKIACFIAKKSAS